jgi:hypothetical protein
MSVVNDMASDCHAEIGGRGHFLTDCVKLLLDTMYLAHFLKDSLDLGEGPLTSLMGEGPLTSVMGEGPHTSLMGEGPLTSVMGEGPRTSLMTNLL